VLAAALCLGPATTSFAHDPGLSALDVHITANRIVATLSLASPDAQAAVEAGGDLATFARDGIEICAGGVMLGGALFHDVGDKTEGRTVSVSFDRPSGLALTVRSKVPAHLARGHRQLLTIRGADGRVLVERMLDARSDAVEVNLDSRHAARRPAEFVALGVTHILGGYDHQLFLAALLLGAPGLGAVVKTVTAFTIAHSITLALAGLGLAQAPAGLVEPLIAASIVFVGIENLAREPGKSRSALTFVFGLVHGFGFAAALQDLRPGAGGLPIVMALGSFNAGVEIGQIAVALALWPLVRLLRHDHGRRLWLVSACSAAITLAGLYWFVERTIF
jgi:hypothetical protein